MKKKIVPVLLVLLIVIQFIRPGRNLSAAVSPNDISRHYTVPDTVAHILQRACNDCHSNNTRYPWYNNIQPVAWWLNDHIIDGKKELNFDEYINKRPRFQYRRMEQTIDLVKKGEMPLDSYTWTHKDAILSEEEKTKLFDWAQSVMDTLKTQYPIDSLKRQGPPPPQK